jgi:DNA-binding transcriptional MerR regulator/methylmalonyl-CoA mutase cobalamin-binding subunit
MYNIKQAAARAGVSVPVLRAWERRYGIVHPARAASGYRQFDDESVARVRSMRALVDDGWSPSAAAAAILARDVPGGDPSSDAAASGAPATRAGIAGRDAEASGLAERFVAAARNLDAGAVDRVLDDLFSRGSFERVATDLLFPALERLGDAWAGGEVTVAGEHLASHAVQRRLGQALEAAGRQGDSGPGVVVGLPPGARHELGALAFAVAARRAGIAVTYLGSDLPVDDWVNASAGMAAAVLGVPTARDRKAATAVATRLRSAHPTLVVAFGGRSAPVVPDVLRLEDALPDAVTTLARALNATHPASPAP